MELENSDGIIMLSLVEVWGHWLKHLVHVQVLKGAWGRYETWTPPPLPQSGPWTLYNAGDSIWEECVPCILSFPENLPFLSRRKIWLVCERCKHEFLFETFQPGRQGDYFFRSSTFSGNFLWGEASSEKHLLFTSEPKCVVFLTRSSSPESFRRSNPLQDDGLTKNL